MWPLLRLLLFPDLIRPGGVHGRRGWRGHLAAPGRGEDLWPYQLCVLYQASTFVLPWEGRRYSEGDHAFLPAPLTVRSTWPCPARGWRHPGVAGQTGRGAWMLAGQDACAQAGTLPPPAWVESPRHRQFLRIERCEREVASCKILGAGELWVVLK